MRCQISLFLTLFNLLNINELQGQVFEKKGFIAHFWAHK